jgi:hypothetical protein
LNSATAHGTNPSCSDPKPAHPHQDGNVTHYVEDYTPTCSLNATATRQRSNYAKPALSCLIAVPKHGPTKPAQCTSTVSEQGYPHYHAATIMRSTDGNTGRLAALRVPRGDTQTEGATGRHRRAGGGSSPAAAWFSVFWVSFSVFLAKCFLGFVKQFLVLVAKRFAGFAVECFMVSWFTGSQPRTDSHHYQQVITVPSS